MYSWRFISGTQKALPYNLVPWLQRVLLRLQKSQTKERYMMTCGAGAGLAAAFNAPLAGVMFSLEELQKNFNSSMLVCIISGCVTSDFISKMSLDYLQFLIFI